MPRTRSTPRVAKSGGDTRLDLVRAAEKLFAARGVGAVSLREVSATAKQANNSAVAYHFGSRDGLLDAILERHSVPIHLRWDAQLDLLQRQGKVDLRTLMEMLVVPIIAKLDDADGGPEFINISAQLAMSPHQPLIDRPITRSPSVLRFVEATLPFYAIPAELLALHFERLASMLYAGIAGWHRMELAGAAPVSRAAFECDLIDSMIALVMTPPSPATMQLLALSAPSPASEGRRKKKRGS